MYRIGIIGAGACGLMCANYLLKKANGALTIDLIEKEPKVGQKILVTGNGRCNFSNINVNPLAYNDPAFVKKVLGSDSVSRLLNVFEELGLLAYKDEEGRIYPVSDNATTVLSVLITPLISDKTKNVRLLTEEEIVNISRNKDTYFVKTQDKLLEYDALVLATGNCLFAKDKSFMNILNRLDLEFTQLEPALTPLVTLDNLKALSGIRVKGKIDLYLNDELYSSEGEILFKANALSGIAAFELSSYLARAKVREENIMKSLVKINLLPDYSDVFSVLQKRRETLSKQEATHFLQGLFNKMINQRIFKQAQLNFASRSCAEISDDELRCLASAIEGLTFTVAPMVNTKPVQVLAGGLKLEQVVAETLECKKHPNLYIGGELLNIDGLCGGYNLHFAFISALKIAEAILAKVEQ